MEATEHVNRLVSRLNLDAAVGDAALNLYRSALAEGEHYDADALGAAAVYVASVVRGVECSQPRLARLSAVPDRVLERHVADLLAVADVPLTP